MTSAVKILGSIAWNGFREARRNRVTVVVGAFALVTLLSTSLVMEITVTTFDRVLTDFGLGTMSLLCSFLAIFLTCGLLPREIERRTIFLVVSKPVSRGTFLIGRFLGNVLTMSSLIAAMTAVLYVQLTVLRTPITMEHHVAVVGLGAEVVLLTALGFFFSSMSSQMVSSVIVTGFYFAGHLARDLHIYAKNSTSALVKTVGHAVYAVLPNLDRLDFKTEAAYAISTPLPDVAASLAYALLYSAALMVGAIAIFDRRDFR